MTWQQIKDSIVWCLMSNGQLYGLTYIREHEIWGWHHHDTGGTVPLIPNTAPVSPSYQSATVPVGYDLIESISVVPYGQYDTLYMEINRTVNGSSVRYIERMAPREFQDLVALSDAVFSDCSTIIDARNTNPAWFMTVTGGPPWTTITTLTVTASGAANTPFVVGDIGNAVVLQRYNASNVLIDQVTILITGYTSSTVVTGTPDKTVPTWAQVAVTTYGKAVRSFTGLTQLPSTAIAVLADGNVVASPNNPAYPTPVVTDGSGNFTLPVNALVVCAGLPITAQLQTLPLENYQGETLTNKQQLINEVTGMFFYARGGFWGQDFNHLYQWNQRNNQPLSTPVALYTGPARIPIQGTWEITGQACLQQVDPLPMGLSAVTATGFTGR